MPGRQHWNRCPHEHAGVARCAPDWLALREDADAAARAPELVPPLRAHLAPAVTGWSCATSAAAPARWPAGSPAGCPARSTGCCTTGTPRCSSRATQDLPGTGRGRQPGHGGGAAGRPHRGSARETSPARRWSTTSALLDLLTAEEVDGIAAACAEAGCRRAADLSVVGRVVLTPADPLDARFAAAFDAHQRRSTGGRRLLGPDAGTAVADAFARRGAAVTTAPSPWRLGAGAGRAGRGVAAGLDRRGVRPGTRSRRRRADDYLRRRLDASRGGRAARRGRPRRRAGPARGGVVSPRVWSWLRMLAGVAVLVALGWRMGADAVRRGARVIDCPAVLAALGFGLLTTVSSAWRWCLVARRLGLRLPLQTAVADCYQALFLNSVLPAGVLGDVHRAVSHGRQEGDVGRGVRAVVLERVTGPGGAGLVGIAALLCRPRRSRPSRPTPSGRHGHARRRGRRRCSRRRMRCGDWRRAEGPRAAVSRVGAALRAGLGTPATGCCRATPGRGRSRCPRRRSAASRAVRRGGAARGTSPRSARCSRC